VSCSPSIKRLRLEDYEFYASLGYAVRPCLKKKEGRKEGRRGGREGGKE
jgi:hypothetical protein